MCWKTEKRYRIEPLAHYLSVLMGGPPQGDSLGLRAAVRSAVDREVEVEVAV